MKKIYLFCTRLFAFWVELPLALVFVVSIIYNQHAEGTFKLYPLIILSLGAMIFFAIYFFRVIEISYAEIRYIGRFTSRDSAMINEGKTHVLTLSGFGKVDIELRGNDGPSELNLAFDEEDGDMEYRLFRGHAFGGVGTVKKVLSYFGVDAASAEKYLRGDFHEGDYEFVSVSSGKNEEEQDTVYIRINKTI